MNLARLSRVPARPTRQQQQQHLFRAAFSTAPARATARPKSAPATPLRVAVPPPPAWKAPEAEEARLEAVGFAQPGRRQPVLPRVTLKSDEIQQRVQPQQVGPALPGELRLVDFMEQVKTELWEFSTMPLRKRFRVQSLLRRLHTPPLETWSGALARATEACPRPFTRTLLARHKAASALLSLPDHVDADAPGFELLLLCWRPGATSVIHDHPKAGCWVKVLKGELKETRYSLASDGVTTSINGTSNGHIGSHNGIAAAGNTGAGGSMIETSSITCNPGAVTYIDDSMGLHKMENPSATEECISLHLYSPGISECTVWADASCARKSVKASMHLDGNFVKQEGK
ncbi:unnamed protein product [Scytosiphon promiscuus]